MRKKSLLFGALLLCGCATSESPQETAAPVETRIETTTAAVTESAAESDTPPETSSVPCDESAAPQEPVLTALKAEYLGGDQEISGSPRMTDFRVRAVYSDGTEAINPDGWSVTDYIDDDNNVVISYHGCSVTVHVSPSPYVPYLGGGSSIRMPEDFTIADTDLYRIYNFVSTDPATGQPIIPAVDTAGIYEADLGTLQPGWNYVDAPEGEEKALIYVPQSGFDTGSIGSCLEAFEWQNAIRQDQELDAMVWDENLYTIAAYRAWCEADQSTADGSGCMTTGEYVCEDITDIGNVMRQFSEFLSGRYRYGAVAQCYVNDGDYVRTVTVFVYETTGWENRGILDECRWIRDTYGDKFDVK